MRVRIFSGGWCFFAAALSITASALIFALADSIAASAQSAIVSLGANCPVDYPTSSHQEMKRNGYAANEP